MTADRLDGPGRVNHAIARRGFLADGIGAMGGTDERGALGRTEPAENGPATLQKLGRQHHIDLSRCRHQCQHGRPTVIRKHFDVVHGRPGPLSHPRDRSPLSEPAVDLCGGDNPVGQHAAALTADGQNRNADRAIRAQRP